MTKNLRIGIILGSTRQGRVSPQVGAWVKQIADEREETAFELIDIAEYRLPFYGEEPAEGSRISEWEQKIDELDGFIFITQEYNHSVSGVLKNALDSAYQPWHNKAAGIVSYGSTGGVRAAEHLRGILGELLVADVRTNPAFSIFTDFVDSRFQPAEHHRKQVDEMLDQLLAWCRALSSLRN